MKKCSQAKLYYQETVNHTINLVQECSHHGKKYIKFIPHLKIPIIPSPKLQKNISEQNSFMQKRYL